MFNNKKNRAKNLENLHRNLQDSFSRVKQDTQNLYAWIQYLHNNHKTISQELQGVKRHVHNFVPSVDHVEKLIRKHYRDYVDRRIEQAEKSVGSSIERLREMERHLDTVKKDVSSFPQNMGEIRKRIEDLDKEVKGSRFRKDVKSDIKQHTSRSSKKPAKNAINKAIVAAVEKYGQVSAIQLRDFIVDKQRLCSKSTFYRVLEELEKQQELGTIRPGEEQAYRCEEQSIIIIFYHNNLFKTGNTF